MANTGRYLGVVLAGGVLLTASLVYASQTIPMSFEDTVTTADAVVLARVIESPEYGEVRTYHTGTTVVVRTHRVLVEQYLKGDGPAEIMIDTLGGKFHAVRDGKQMELYEQVGAQPQLPPVGAEVLLFVTRYGPPGNFMICSASHGVVLVRRQPDGTRVAALRFSRPEVMPAPVSTVYDRTASVAGGGVEPFTADVAVSDLKDAVERAMHSRPKDATASTNSR
jgi:hypothetical protein